MCFLPWRPRFQYNHTSQLFVLPQFQVFIQLNNAWHKAPLILTGLSQSVPRCFVVQSKFSGMQFFTRRKKFSIKSQLGLVNSKRYLTRENEAATLKRTGYPYYWFIRIFSEEEEKGLSIRKENSLFLVAEKWKGYYFRQRKCIWYIKYNILRLSGFPRKFPTTDLTKCGHWDLSTIRKAEEHCFFLQHI